MDINFVDGLALLEAITYAESRGVVLPAVYYNLLVGLQRAQSTTIAGLASIEQIKFVIDLVTESMKDGSTFEEFQKRVKAGDATIDLPRYRLDNIFRTNMQIAYNRGRWEQQKKVAGSRPYLMYDAINDSRTRPSHIAMENTILHRDDPWWKTNYPPNGFRCRCTVISLTEDQAGKRGIRTNGPDVKPDKGFEFNPGENYDHVLDARLSELADQTSQKDPKLAQRIRDARARINDARNHALGDQGLPPA